MNIGIVGNGVVGSAIARFFAANSRRRVAIFDKYQAQNAGEAQRRKVNSSDLVFLCVPTPQKEGELGCDTSAVRECVDWIGPPICIRSTVTPGTVDSLVETTKKAIVFSPEYLGEHPNHPWRQEADCGFMIVGGSGGVRELVISAYDDYLPASFRFYRTTARTAELCKYMENCFLATKVAFVNQFYDIAAAFGVGFAELRELWLADPRIGASHSSVTKQRGFRGRCLPKDVAALVSSMQVHGGAPLLEAVLDYNTRICETADGRNL